MAVCTICKMVFSLLTKPVRPTFARKAKGRFVIAKSELLHARSHKG
jgi:hypothetical protein